MEIIVSMTGDPVGPHPESGDLVEGVPHHHGTHQGEVLQECVDSGLGMLEEGSSPQYDNVFSAGSEVSYTGVVQF